MLVSELVWSTSTNGYIDSQRVYDNVGRAWIVTDYTSRDDGIDGWWIYPIDPTSNQPTVHVGSDGRTVIRHLKDIFDLQCKLLSFTLTPEGNHERHQHDFRTGDAAA